MGVKWIGEPLEAVCVWAAAYGRGQEAGQDRIYAVSSGKPCVLLVIDPHAGKCLERWPLEGASHSWGVVATASGVYITGDGNLYRYRAGEALENLGTIISGEHYTWRAAADAEGMIYGGCYPGGKAFQYNPQTGQFRNYGVVVEGEQYVRCMKAWDGKLYIGIGTQRPYLVEMDTNTGDKSIIPLPPEAQQEQLVYDLDIVYPKLIIRCTPSNAMFVYDMEEREWTDRIDDAAGLAVSPADEEGNVFFVKSGYLHVYHLATKQLRSTGIPQPEPAADFGWIEQRDPARPGASLLWMNRDGTYSLYHPATGAMKVVDPQPQGQPVTIQSMTQGPDGNIYVGGYFAGALAVYKPASVTMQLYRKIGQIENMIAFQGKVYMGVYPKANIFCYDPESVWENGQNPELLFSLRAHRQDRPFAFTAAGQRLAIGTVPDYGCLGGALTLYDPVANHYDTYTNIADRQSIVSLAYRNGLIYAGGSIWGGLGIVPATEEALLTVWDAERAAVVWQGISVAGEKAISALAFDDSGMLWGLTSGYLFQFDPESRKVLQTVELFAFDWSSVGHYWRGGYLLYREDGKLVGSTLKRLFTYDIRTGQLDVLDEDAFLLASDPQGHVYFARDTQLYQYQWEAASK
ncbi:WD40 repeat domain-containing protein [Paenibacillus sp. GCM10027626]|uniref:WD40 repeat domain-containing protein n=1 Tax=Paenibacillus sp. GCM10027626 TaxID=3273411 RepID=UPI003627C888